MKVLTFLTICSLWIATITAQCNNFLTLDFEERRGLNIPKPEPSLIVCDDNIVVDAWYRIDRDIPTTRVPVDFCGTAFPVWLNGSIPTVTNVEEEVKVCINRDDNSPPCGNFAMIKVINCGAYRVYKLTPLPCPSAYCVDANTTGEFFATTVPTVVPTYETAVTTFAVPEAVTDAGTPTQEANVQHSTITEDVNHAETTTQEGNVQHTTTATDEEDPTEEVTVQPTVAETTALIVCPSDSQLRPFVVNVGNNGLCDTHSGVDCDQPTVTLFSASTVQDSDTIQCRVREEWIGDYGPVATGVETVVPGVFVNCNQVVCQLQPASMPPQPGLILARYIAVGTTLQEYGTEGIYVTYDSQCVSCNIATVPMCTRDASSCFIGGTCYMEGARNPSDMCEICDVMTSQTTWSPADDMCLINGTCLSNGTADPMNACLACNTASSTSYFTVTAGTCFIDGQCYSDGEDNPVAGLCEVCDSSRDIEAFSTDTSMCSINGTCYPNGTVDPAQACVVCNVDISLSQFSPLDGFCVINGQCYNDGEASPAVGSCEICNVGLTTTAFSPDDSMCSVNGVCYANGTGDPAQACLLCNVDMSTAQLSSIDGFCFIDGQCYSDGEANPTPGSCEVCNVGLTTMAFSAASSVCNINGQCYANQQVDPTNPCQLCDTSVRTSGWTQNQIMTASGLQSCSSICDYLGGNTVPKLDLVCDSAFPFPPAAIDSICIVEDLAALSACTAIPDIATRFTAFCGHVNSPSAQADIQNDPVACP